MAGFVSQIGSREIVINERNWREHRGDQVVDGERKTRGLIPRDYRRNPYGSRSFDVASAFPSELLLSYDEIDEIIEEMERTNTRPSDIIKTAGLDSKDQDGTNYCWINSPIYAMETLMVVQNEPIVELSPASVGAMIKRGQNVGGWGTEGLQYCVEHGAVPESAWPANEIRQWRSLDNSETRTLRKRYRVTEWWKLRARNEREILSALCHGFPLCSGLNWWSHEVTYHDPMKFGNRKYGVRFRNSWGNGYGENGYGVLQGTRHLADDAVVPRSLIPASSADRAMSFATAT